MIDTFFRTPDSEKTLSRATQLCLKIDDMASTESIRKRSTQVASNSFKTQAQQIQSVPISKSPQFTKSSLYLEGKKKLMQSSKGFEEELRLLKLIKIVDKADPRGTDFLTPDIMQSRLIRKIFNNRKRIFGNTQTLFIPDEGHKLYYEGLDTKQLLMLKKILYNYSFLNSNDSKNKKIQHYLNLKLKPKNKIEPLSLSPRPAKGKSEKLLYKDIELSKYYDNAIKQNDLENGLNKLKLSRLVNLRGVFHS